MVRLTLIARKHDGLPLSEGLDSDNHHDMEPYKQQAKVINNRPLFCTAVAHILLSR